MTQSKFLNEAETEALMQTFTPKKDVIEHFRNDLGETIYHKMKGENGTDTDFALALLAVHCEDKSAQEFAECFDVLFGDGALKQLQKLIHQAVMKNAKKS